ncbi:MAG TPA: hypothetical protein DCZ01_05220 [Elusimicrobia bacterium]|nr:MAG: hypothetical protein A2X37_08365 [Elusimicrobia bacterium GWA2_66_18]HAZ07923.1 hypothetical protein [Elusimicrobiota bacterium]
MFLALLLALDAGATRAGDAAGGPLKSVRLGLLVPRRTMSALGRRPLEERRKLLGVIRAALESRFAAVIPLADVGRVHTSQIDVLAILHVRLAGAGSGADGRVDVELAFWTPRASRLTAIKVRGEGPRAGEDVAARIAEELSPDVSPLPAGDALRRVGSTPKRETDVRRASPAAGYNEE